MKTCSRITFTILAQALLLGLFGIIAYAQQSASNGTGASEVQKLIDAGHVAQAAKPPRLADAEKLFDKALAAARNSNDKSGESVALRNLGNISRFSGQPEKAVERYQQSLDAAISAGNKHEQANTLFNMALMFAAAQPDKALELSEQARALYHDSVDRKGEGQTLSLIGHLLAQTGQKEQAKEKYDLAIAVAHSVHDTKGEADALWYLGVMAWTSDDKLITDRAAIAKAKDYMHQARVLYHQLHAVADEAGTFDLIAGFDLTLGTMDVARLQYERALALYRELGDDRKVALTLTTLSNVAGLQDRRMDALRYDQEALEIYRKLGDDSGQALQLSALGAHYSSVGQQRSGLQYRLQALRLFEQAGDVEQQVSTLTAIGQIYDILRDHGAAVSYYDQVIPLLEKPASALAKKHNLGVLATIYIATGNLEKAHETLLQQLEDFKTSGLTSLIPTTFSLLAQVERAQGKSDIALAKYQEALKLSASSENGQATASILDSISEIEEEKGDLAEAEATAHQAVEALEHSGIALGGLAEAKSTFLTTYIGVYKHYLSLLLKQNKLAEAFAFAQKIKARGLLDLQSHARVQLGKSLSNGDRQEERSLLEKSDALNYQLIQTGVQNEVGSQKLAEAIKVKLAANERDLQFFRDKLYVRHPEVARIRAESTLDIQALAKQIPSDSALLEYVTLKTRNHDETVVFVLTTGGGVPKLSAKTLPATTDEIKFAANWCIEACSSPKGDYRSPSVILYNSLILPIEPLIAGKRHLIICPDGPIWNVPFAVLAASNNAAKVGMRDYQQFLIERFQLTYAYSATGLCVQSDHASNPNHHKPVGSMLAFADPDYGGEQRFSGSGQHSARPISLPSRPISLPSRPISLPSRPISLLSRPISLPSRPIALPSREILVPRGGSISPLPGTLREAQALRADFNDAAIFTGQAAQESTAKKEMGKYRFLHFATHAFVNDAAPLLSSVVLATPNASSGDDGFLTAREIFDLNLNADMVVLSACNTARGEQRDGEGIVGLTWAFFAAGVPTQVVSQWSVDDASTSVLMERFYDNLTHKHMDKGQALCEAQRSLLRAPAPSARKKPRRRVGRSSVSERNWSHPYYWAPFVLIGAPR